MVPQSLGVLDCASNEGSEAMGSTCPPSALSSLAGQRCSERPRCPQLAATCPNAKETHTSSCRVHLGALGLVGCNHHLIFTLDLCFPNFTTKLQEKTISCKLDIPVEAENYFSGQRAQFPTLRCMIKIN